MMKKVLLGLIAAAAMTSCIKREDSLATDQATNLGSGTVTGTILAKTDYLGDTLPNGADDFNNLGVSGLEGFTVVATYTTGDLDPDGVNGEGMVLNTTTDANGEYSFTVPATGQGTAVTVEINGEVELSVFHDDAARCELDTSFNVIPQTETVRFISDDLGAPSYTTTVRNGETETRAREVLESEQLF